MIKLCLIPMILTSIIANAQTAYFVASPEGTQVLDRPYLNGKAVGKLSKGQKVYSVGVEENGFIKIQTKSGRPLYVQASQVNNLDKPEDISQDLASEDDSKPKSKKTNDAEPWQLRSTYDLGVSTGSYGGKAYTEAELGLNLFFLKWLAWRNGLFGRFVSPDNFYGLDSSLRANFAFGAANALGVTIFGGPGYRFVSRGTHAPFGEAGALLHLAGFTVGGGIKTILHQWVNKDYENDTYYFITLAGGGSL